MATSEVSGKSMESSNMNDESNACETTEPMNTDNSFDVIHETAKLALEKFKAEHGENFLEILQKGKQAMEIERQQKIEASQKIMETLPSTKEKLAHHLKNNGIDPEDDLLWKKLDDAEKMISNPTEALENIKNTQEIIAASQRQITIYEKLEASQQQMQQMSEKMAIVESQEKQKTMELDTLHTNIKERMACDSAKELHSKLLGGNSVFINTAVKPQPISSINNNALSQPTTIVSASDKMNTTLQSSSSTSSSSVPTVENPYAKASCYKEIQGIHKRETQHRVNASARVDPSGATSTNKVITTSKSGKVLTGSLVPDNKDPGMQDVYPVFFEATAKLLKQMNVGKGAMTVSSSTFFQNIAVGTSGFTPINEYNR